MLSRQEIEEILESELNSATQRYNLARTEFTSIISDVPSGLPQPDGTLRIQNAARAQTAARESLMTSLRRFTDFNTKGIVPPELQESQGNDRRA